MENKLYKTVSWDEFMKLVKQHFDVIPRAGVDDYYKKSNGEYIQAKWHPMGDCKKVDRNILIGYLTNLSPFKGELLILTESAYIRDDVKPFIVDSSNIYEFIKYHEENFGLFFQGDLVIMSLTLKVMWIVHHEGVYAFINHNNK